MCARMHWVCDFKGIKAPFRMMPWFTCVWYFRDMKFLTFAIKDQSYPNNEQKPCIISKLFRTSCNPSKNTPSVPCGFWGYVGSMFCTGTLVNFLAFIVTSRQLLQFPAQGWTVHRQRKCESLWEHNNAHFLASYLLDFGWSIDIVSIISVNLRHIYMSQTTYTVMFDSYLLK